MTPFFDPPDPGLVGSGPAQRSRFSPVTQALVLGDCTWSSSSNRHHIHHGTFRMNSEMIFANFPHRSETGCENQVSTIKKSFIVWCIANAIVEKWNCEYTTSEKGNQEQKRVKKTRTDLVGWIKKGGNCARRLCAPPASSRIRKTVHGPVTLPPPRPRLIKMRETEPRCEMKSRGSLGADAELWAGDWSRPQVAKNVPQGNISREDG